MPDMLVKLYNIQQDHDLLNALQTKGIEIKRALAPDRIKILRFIEANADQHWSEESKDAWMSECETALSNNPPSCFLAVRQHAIIGFACYNATAKGFFGPTGVLMDHQKMGIGKALLLTALLAMWDEGYGYAIIGWASDESIGFYQKTIDAQVIPDSSPGVYSRMV